MIVGRKREMQKNGVAFATPFTSSDAPHRRRTGVSALHNHLRARQHLFPDLIVMLLFRFAFRKRYVQHFVDRGHVVDVHA